MKDFKRYHIFLCAIFFWSVPTLVAYAAPLDITGGLHQLNTETDALVLDLPLAPNSNEMIAMPNLAQSTAIVGDLNAPSMEAVGLTHESRFGMTDQLWGALNALEMLTIFNRMPSHITSPTLQDLAQYLLTRIAYFPDLQTGTPQILVARVGKLGEMGLTEQALALSELSPHFPPAPQKALKRDILALQGRVPEACTLVHDSLKEWQTPEWQRSALVCHAMEGHGDAARLKWELLKENAAQTPALTPLLSALDAALSDGKMSIDDLQLATPLEALYIVGEKKLLPSDEALKSAPLVVLRALATSPKVAPLTRIQAAELAAAHGAISLQELETTYKILPLGKAMGAESTPAQLARTLALESNPFKRRAWLSQALKQTSDDATRAELIDALWQARPLPLSFKFQSMLAPLALEIHPDHVGEKTRASVAPTFVQLLALEKSLSPTLLAWLQDVPQTSHLRPLVALKIRALEDENQGLSAADNVVIGGGDQDAENDERDSQAFFETCPKTPNGLVGAELVTFWGPLWPTQSPKTTAVFECLDQHLPELKSSLLNELLGTITN